MKQNIIIVTVLLWFVGNCFAPMDPVFSNQTATVTDKWNASKIQEFVDNAVMGGMMEVELGKTAEQKGNLQAVKDYGKLMKTDHSEALKKLKVAVLKAKFTYPTILDKKNHEKMDKLTGKTGNDFDKEYVKMMVKDHKDDVAEFEKAQSNVPAGPVKDWIDNTIPVLRKHLDKIKEIQNQIK